MIREFKNNFMQVSFVTTIWILFLSTVFIPNRPITLLDVWRLVGIAMLFGLTFGIVYPYLWNYSTFKASINIAISTVINATCGITSVYLFSTEMFQIIVPFILLILLATLLGHIAGFYFYSKYENNKLTKEINTQFK